MKILHVEVGGSYGGSLRALELYLANTDGSEASYDVLLYYPTPGSDRLASKATRLWILSSPRPSRFESDHHPKRTRPFLSVLKKFSSINMLDEVVSWVSLLRGLPVASRLLRLLRSDHYDLVHVNNSFTYQIPTILAAKIAGIAVVAFARNPQRNSFFNRMIMRLTNHVVSNSRFYENELKSWGLRVPLATCYNGIEPPEVNETGAQQLRASLLSGGNILIGTVGRLDHQKGYEDLICAARRVTDARPDVRFAIAGEGPLRARLEGLIADLKLQGRFHLCGFRRDIGNFLAALTVFVNSSHWEGLPVSVVEAMLLGKPVVATDVGGTSEVVISGQTGKLVPAGNPEALAAALLSTLENEGEALRQAEKARELATAMFNPSSNARQLDGILRSVF